MSEVSINTTLAYLAGFFDGEGCVYIIRHRRKKPPLISFSMEVSFTGSDKAPLALTQETFGGQITKSVSANPERKPVFRLRLRSQQASAALEAMLPYLLVKKERATLGIAFQKRMSAPRTGGRGPAIPVEEAERLKVHLTSLNDKVWNRGQLTT